VKIGNSQGIRIPKPLVEQARLDGKEPELQLVKGGLQPMMLNFLIMNGLIYLLTPMMSWSGNGCSKEV